MADLNYTKAGFVDDIIYQTPENLLKEALIKQDDYYNKGLTVLDGIDDKIRSIEVLPINREEKDQILSSYYAKKDELVNALYNDKKNFKKYLPQIRTFGSEFAKDLTSGRLYTLSKANTDFKSLADKAKEGKWDNTYKNAVNNAFINNFQSEGISNPNFDLPNYIDENSIAKTYKDLLAKDKVEVSNTKKSGLYFVTDEEGRAYLDRDKIQKAFIDSPEYSDLINKKAFEYQHNEGLSEEQATKKAKMYADYFTNNLADQLESEELSSKHDIKGNSTATQIYLRNLENNDSGGYVVKQPIKNNLTPQGQAFSTAYSGVVLLKENKKYKNSLSDGLGVTNKDIRNIINDENLLSAYKNETGIKNRYDAIQSLLNSATENIYETIGKNGLESAKTLVNDYASQDKLINAQITDSEGNIVVSTERKSLGGVLEDLNGYEIRTNSPIKTEKMDVRSGVVYTGGAGAHASTPIALSYNTIDPKANVSINTPVKKDSDGNYYYEDNGNTYPINDPQKIADIENKANRVPSQISTIELNLENAKTHGTIVKKERVVLNEANKAVIKEEVGLIFNITKGGKESSLFIGLPAIQKK